MEGALGLKLAMAHMSSILSLDWSDVPLGRTVRGVVLGASDDLGHVFLEELLAPRGGRVVDEGERRDDIFLRRGEVDPR